MGPEAEKGLNVLEAILFLLFQLAVFAGSLVLLGLVLFVLLGAAWEAIR